MDGNYYDLQLHRDSWSSILDMTVYVIPPKYKQYIFSYSVINTVLILIIASYEYYIDLFQSMTHIAAWLSSTSILIWECQTFPPRFVNKLYKKMSYSFDMVYSYMIMFGKYFQMKWSIIISLKKALILTKKKQRELIQVP